MKESLLYDGVFWSSRIDPELQKLDITHRIHLIFTLIAFLNVPIAPFLEFLFSSKIHAVKQRVGYFFSRRYGMPDNPHRVLDLWAANWKHSEPALEAWAQTYGNVIALRESDAVIKSKDLQIRTSQVTVEKIRTFLRPEQLIEKYQELAPFTWSILKTFAMSPNRYRIKKAQSKKKNTAGATGGGTIRVNDESDSDSDTLEMEDERTRSKRGKGGPAKDEDGYYTNGSELPDGFSRNPLLVILVVISMLAFVRNRSTNILPLALGLFFKINGTGSRALTLLSNIGISVSEVTIERLKEQVSKDAVNLAVGVVASGQLFYTIFDNINIYLKKFQQRVTNKNSMIHATNSAIIAIDEEGIVKEAATNLSSYLDIRGKRSSAQFSDVRPTSDDTEHMTKAFRFLIAKMIAQYCPGSSSWPEHAAMLERIEKERPDNNPLPVKKTYTFPLGVFDVNEGSKHGIIKVLEAIPQRLRVSLDRWSSKVRIMVGDWLTSSNIRAARRDRVGDVDSMERLEYIAELSALFHFALQATHMLMRLHYGFESRDPTSLAKHKGLLGRTWDVNKPNYAPAKSLIRHSLIARILHVVMVYKGYRKWSQLTQEWKPNVEEILALAAKITDEYAMSAAGWRAKEKKDDWLAHSIFFIRDALCFCEFEDAVSHADASRVLRMFKFWALAFRGAGQHNYARECVEVLLKWKYELSPNLRTMLERAWFINRWGEKGRWMASDLYLEQNNYWVKRVFIAQGNAVTVKYIIEKGSACVEAFRDISHTVSTFFGDPDRSRRSKEISFALDLRVLVEHMESQKLHRWSSTEEHLVQAPRGKKAKSQLSESVKSAITDVMVQGAGIWAGGKFTDFLNATTYDPALGYPVPTSDAAIFDQESNPLACDEYADLHGDSYSGGVGALGGGGEFSTGQEIE